MLEERNIKEEWVRKTSNFPDMIEREDDGTAHYMKKINEYGNRWLRVIVNEQAHPSKIITAFFDRRLRRKCDENKS